MKNTTYPSSSDQSEPDGTGQEEERNVDSLGQVPIFETDNLDETVLGAAALENPDRIAPEIAAGTGELTEWDEPPGESGTWTPRFGMDDGVVHPERLVEAGIEEADRERRLAAGESED